ncbi:MAG: DNA-processing protein DprA [Anaerolineales bacterium]|nr:DNA-processing protein DprA [Anaerolineales bacterium]
MKFSSPSPVWTAKGEPHYPANLVKHFGEGAPEGIACIGNLELLESLPMGVFGSVRCPASLILQAHDMAQSLRKKQTPVISGFHSPVEKEVLSVLLRGYGPLVICMARGLEGMRVPSEYHKPLEDGRLTLISSFDSTVRRAQAKISYERNRLVAALAERILVLHAEPGGKLESLCQELVGWGKPIHTIKDTANENLIHLGVLEWKG